jgi:hypothetical protein
MERAVDAEGAHVAGMFRMRYADGTYSGAGNVFEIDAMRRQALAGEAPEATLTQEDYAADVEAQVLRNDDALSVVDIEGGAAERYGSDMVALNFRDGTRGITQKALYEAAASLGADPTIAARRLTAVSTYAPDSEAAQSAANAEVEPSALMAQPGTAQARPQATPLPKTGDISANTAATPVTDGVEADRQKISETLEVVGPALGEVAASLQVSEQDFLNDLLDGEDESA